MGHWAAINARNTISMKACRTYSLSCFPLFDGEALNKEKRVMANSESWAPFVNTMADMVNFRSFLIQKHTGSLSL